LSNYSKIINFYVFADYIRDKVISDIYNKMQYTYFIYIKYIYCIYKTEIGIDLESIRTNISAVLFVVYKLIFHYVSYLKNSDE